MTYASIVVVIIFSLMEIICFGALFSIIGYIRRDKGLNDWFALFTCICLMLLLSIPIVSLLTGEYGQPDGRENLTGPYVEQGK